MHGLPSWLQLHWRSARSILAGAGGLIALLSIIRWGGAARTGAALAAGVAVLAGLIAAFGMLAWCLYRSPAPARPALAAPRSANLHQLVVMLVIISGMLFVVGA